MTWDREEERRTHPALTQLMQGYFEPGSAETARVAVQRFLAAPEPQRDARGVAALDELVSLRGLMSDVEVAHYLGNVLGEGLGAPDPDVAPALVAEIEATLRDGDPLRHLFRPWQARTKASSFRNRRTAEKAASAVFRAHEQRVLAWGASPQLRLALDHWFPKRLGTIVTADGRKLAGHVAVVVTIHDGERVTIESTYLNPGAPDADGKLASYYHDALFQLFAGQLSEDYPDDYASVGEAVDDFATAYPAAVAKSAYDDLRALRARLGDSDELMDLLLQLGNGVPTGDGAAYTTTGYLDLLEAKLAHHLPG